MKTDKQLKSSPPQKMKVYESYSDWEKQESKINKLTKVVSQHVQKSAPALATSVKWGQGCFLKDGTPNIYIHTEPDHIQLGFFKGVNLNDPNKFLEGMGKYLRHIKIVEESDVQENDVEYFIEQVV